MKRSYRTSVWLAYTAGFLALASAVWAVVELRGHGPGTPFGVSEFGFRAVTALAWGFVAFAGIVQARRCKERLQADE